MVPSVPECLTCGACCFSRLETYVRATGDDYARLGERADELVHFDGNRAYMRMVDGHCAALRVDHGSGRFVCSAYETRPQTCRDLARGSGACLGELATKYDRPQLALNLSKRTCPRSIGPELNRDPASSAAGGGDCPGGSGQAADPLLGNHIVSGTRRQLVADTS